MSRRYSGHGTATTSQQPRKLSATSLAKKKRPLLPPTTFGEICMAVLLHVCREYLLFKLNLKLLIYALIVLFGSFVRDFVPLPGVYFSRKENVLNVFFVKWSWAWTLVTLAPFIYCTAVVYSAGDKRNIRQQMARLIVGTIIWFLCTNFFVRFGRWSGLCTKIAYNNDYRACVTNGGHWKPFDISGHVFLLTYICLLNAEECTVFRNWFRIRQVVLDDLHHAEVAATEDGTSYNANAGRSSTQPTATSTSLTCAELTRVRDAFNAYSPFIQWNFVLISALNVVWEFCLVITTLYYHTAAQKIVAFALACACWYATYRIWYRTPHSPGMPGHCKIRYIFCFHRKFSR